MVELLIVVGGLASAGCVAYVLVRRMVAKRIERRRVRRVVAHGFVIVHIRAPRGPQAVRRAVAQ
ncbi:MAG TPA: hypothetical protein VIT90_14395 [Lysobacter sp.]